MVPSSTQGKRTGIHTLSDYTSHTVTQPATSQPTGSQPAISQPTVTHGSQHEEKKAGNDDKKHVIQIGMGGHNPQMKGDIKVDGGGDVNLGIQEDMDIPQDNKDNPRNNKDFPQDNKGNAQIGGGGFNPQLHGNITASGGGTVNLGVQRKKDNPKDNKDSPQDNKDSPQDNKDKKGNAQIGGGGHNP